MTEAKALEVHFENVEWLDQMEGYATPEFITFGTKGTQYKVKETNVKWDGVEPITLWFYRITTFKELVDHTISDEKSKLIFHLDVLGPDDMVFIPVSRNNLRTLEATLGSVEGMRIVTSGPIGADYNEVKVRCLIGYQFTHLQAGAKSGLFKPTELVHTITESGTPKLSSLRTPANDKDVPFSKFWVHLDVTQTGDTIVCGICGCEEP